MKYFLLHHDGCPRARFHYVVHPDGRSERCLDDGERGQHAGAIGIRVAGRFDEALPAPAQIAALKALLLELKLRYPGATVGTHRQVRGDLQTTCPGRRFPAKALAQWSETELIRLRDEKLTEEVESQYKPRT